MENILDTASGRTSPELSQATEEPTSSPSSKPSVKSKKVEQFLYLNLKSGNTQESSWEKVTALPGVSMTLNFGAYPSVAKESTLSSILQMDAPERYCLSRTACQGILRRAEKRGKELPGMLRDALLEIVNDRAE